LALLTAKFTNPGGSIPNVEHPPIKTYLTPSAATTEGLFVIMPSIKPRKDRS
jgi:hypothetical protein